MVYGNTFKFCRPTSVSRLADLGNREFDCGARSPNWLCRAGFSMDVCCLAFSDHDDRLACATEMGHFWFFHVTVPSWLASLVLPEPLGRMRSTGLLRNGRPMVVNIGGSIQLLAREPARPSGTGLDPEISRVYPLDNGRAIGASSRDRGGVNLEDHEGPRHL